MKIPPLKPSPYLDNKENLAESNTALKPSSSTKEPLRRYSTTNSSPLRRSVLRPGESIESLFRLEGTTEEYKTLCKDLVAQNVEQPFMWRKALGMATEFAERDTSRGKFPLDHLLHSFGI